MTDSNTQAVAQEVEAGVTPAAETTGAQDTTQDLDSLLQEFETSAKPAPAPQAVPASQNAELAEVKRELADIRFQREIEPILKGVRGDIPSDVISDAEFIDLLDGRAKRDPALRNAYAERQANPRKWAQIQKALNAEYTKKFQPRVDAAATADKEAVAAAVRGTSTKAPEEKAPSYGSMNNSEFQKELAKHGVN